MPSKTDSCFIADAISELENKYDLAIYNNTSTVLSYDLYINLRNNLVSNFYTIYNEYVNIPSYRIRGVEFLIRLRRLMFKYNKMLIDDYDRDFYPY
jgi:hypothetical protein